MLKISADPLKWYTVIVGFGLWFPALAVPVGGGVYLQLIDIATALSILLVFNCVAHLNPSTIAVLALANASWVLALMNDGSASIFAYYFIFINIFSILITSALATQDRQSSFVSAFIFGGITSQILALAQILLGAEALDFRTNLNFSLPPHYGRAFSLFPEVSLFAAMTIPFVVIVAMRAFSARGFSLNRLGLFTILAIALMNLAVSRSTSVLAVLPLIAIYAFIADRRLNLRTILRVVFAGALVSFFIFLFITLFYSDRLGSTASAGRSINIRFASIIAAANFIYEGNIFGVGLGNNSEVAWLYSLIVRQLGLSVDLTAVGVNSFIVSRVFEEGIIGALQIGISLFFMWRVLNSRGNCSLAIKVLLLSFLLSAAVISGYRGLYEYWLILIAPTGMISPRAKKSSEFYSALPSRNG